MIILEGMTMQGTAETVDDRLSEAAIHPHVPIHHTLLITRIELVTHTHVLRPLSALQVPVDSGNLENGPENIHTIEIIDSAGKMINDGLEDEIYLAADTTVLHLRMTHEETIRSGQGTTGATITTLTVGPTLLTGHRLVVHLQELPLALSQLVLVSQPHPQDRVLHPHPVLPILCQLLVLGPPLLHHPLHRPQIPAFPIHLSRLRLAQTSFHLSTRMSKFPFRDPMHRRMYILLLRWRCGLRSPPQKRWLAESRPRLTVIKLRINIPLRH